MISSVNHINKANIYFKHLNFSRKQILLINYEEGTKIKDQQYG